MLLKHLILQSLVDIETPYLAIPGGYLRILMDIGGYWIKILNGNSPEGKNIGPCILGVRWDFDEKVFCSCQQQRTQNPAPPNPCPECGTLT